MKKNILDLTKEELSNEVKPSFRAKQIYNWIYHKDIQKFADMQNIPKDLRRLLDEKYTIDPLSIV
jgi:23S rRNA (adenine2503-C2)-methyltransferase